MLASKIVWLDAFLTNVDRTARNTNMLVWNRELWLIDHGAGLYFHHNWPSWGSQMKSPFTLIKDHVLLKQATLLPDADAACRSLLSPEIINNIVDALPNEWLAYEEAGGDTKAVKEVYQRFLNFRLQNSEIYLNQAINARAALI